MDENGFYEALIIILASSFVLQTSVEPGMHNKSKIANASLKKKIKWKRELQRMM